MLFLVWKILKGRELWTQALLKSGFGSFFPQGYPQPKALWGIAESASAVQRVKKEVDSFSGGLWS